MLEPRMTIRLLLPARTASPEILEILTLLRLTFAVAAVALAMTPLAQSPIDTLSKVTLVVVVVLILTPAVLQLLMVTFSSRTCFAAITLTPLVPRVAPPPLIDRLRRV